MERVKFENFPFENLVILRLGMKPPNTWRRAVDIRVLQKHGEKIFRRSLKNLVKEANY
tara:strand:- start:359 stop:532 length:174 start_codon:yes stop_codon:yes gene_type:complete